MKTKYSAKIRQLLEGKLDEEDFKTWLQEQPLLDQAEIFREIKATVEAEVPSELLEESEISTLDESIDAFEEQILEVKLNQELDALKDKEIEKKKEELADAYETLRASIIASINEGNGDAEGNKTLIRQMIANEKKFNIYYPEKWKDVLGML
ncbi:hypothetical protein [Flavobacterium sp. SM2513]|uniref:hypothetical protein n=1 Tax=Flavobacterium sp. SM2513 TaxID=3424766 RepID=UPI003D7F2F99